MKRTHDTWPMDAIQFPRLLAEIGAVGITSEQAERLAEAMDVEPHNLDEVFSRAHERWKAIKAATLDKDAPQALGLPRSGLRAP